jgi:hypothetical protein
MEVDYRVALMTMDHSRTAVMVHLMNHLSGDIEKEVEKWVKEEVTRRRNALRPRLQEDTEMYYTQCWKKITQDQDQIAKANCQEYYDKCYIDLIKDADAQLKQEIKAYREEKGKPSGTRQTPRCSWLTN